MATPTSSGTQDRATNISQRGAFYDGMGLALLVGLLVVVGLGVLGVTSLGWFTLSTAMAMIGLSIGLLAVVSYLTLRSMRRTIGLVTRHEAELAEQADRHAALAKNVQNQRQVAQTTRDQGQDSALASLSDRQDAHERRFTEVKAQSERNRAARAAENEKKDPSDPFEGGQIHPVRDVEGIGPHYGKLLENMGITDTRELWHEDPVYAAGVLKTTPHVIGKWQNMSELMAINGIAEQYAEVLTRAGVSSVRDLASQSPKKLLDQIQRLEDRLEPRVQGNTIGAKVVESWVKAAQAHPNGGPSPSDVVTAAEPEPGE